MKDALALTAATMLLLVSGVVLPGTAAAGERCEITDLIAYSVEDALESRVEAFPSCDGGPAPEAAPRVPEPVTYETAQAPDVHEYGGYTVQTVEAHDPTVYIRAQGGVPLTWTYESGNGKHAFALQTDPGYAIDAGVGRRLAQWGPFRLDGEFAVGYRRGPINNLGEFEANLNSLRFTGNAIVTVGEGWLQPYGGGGVGYVASSFEPQDSDKLSLTDHGYGYNFIVGATFRVAGPLRFDTRYVYEGDEGISIGGKINNDHANSVERHVFLAGLRADF